MKNFINKHKDLLSEIFRFLLVGGLATVVDFIIYELCRFVIFSGLSNNINLKFEKNKKYNSISLRVRSSLLCLRA